MGIAKNGLTLSKRSFITSVILFAAFFIFYYVFFLNVLPYAVAPFSENLFLIEASFSLTIALTLVIASLFMDRLENVRIIYFSLVSTTVMLVLLFFAPSYYFRLISVGLIGVLFGLGQLAFFTYFWESTGNEERGRTGGFIAFATLPIYFLAIIMASASGDFLGTTIIAILLSLGGIAGMFLRPKKAKLLQVKQKNGDYPEKRTVILYLVPWILFSLVNATLSRNISAATSSAISSSFYTILLLVQIIAALFGALSAGLIADFVGRRLAIALSITLYGISMAFSGLIQDATIFYFKFAAEGLSWGILLTLYSFVIWGDLANKENRAKMYSIGLVTFYLTAVIGILPTPISQIPISASALIGCSLIFLSNVPIALAPELLSSDFRERIRLNLHMKAVKKIKKQLLD